MAAAVTEQEAADPGFRLYQAADLGDVAAVKQLLDDGADMMWADADGTTALMKAAENGHQTIVAELLDAGAPWNQQDNDGYCAGEYATASKNRDIVELIMEWGVQAELMLMAAERWVLVGSRSVRMLLY
jgi:ankyrin repeat protein